MRTHGTLSKWNDDRGFGFITPAQGVTMYSCISPSFRLTASGRSCMS